MSRSPATFSATSTARSSVSSRSRGQFSATVWGSLPQFEAPHAIFNNGQLILKPAPLAVLLVFCEAAKAQYTRREKLGIRMVEFQITQQDLMDRTGYSENVVSRAVTTLDGKFIRQTSTRSKDGQYDTKVYTLCEPTNGFPLLSKSRNSLLSNGVRYIKLPLCLVREHEQPWSIARINGSPLRVYVSLCMLANNSKEADPRVTVTVRALKKLSGLSTTKLVEDSIATLEDAALISVHGDQIMLHNPYTGEPLHVEDGDPTTNPANYHPVSNKRGDKLNVNTGDPDAVMRLLLTCGVEPEIQSSGELRLLCPYHKDKNPSLFVNPKKRVFKCHGCSKGGHLTDLVMQLAGVDKGTAWQMVAAASGQEVEFQQPDQDAEAIYDYRGGNGKLVKQVLRYPGKQFKQRRPRTGGGWIYGVKGLRPILYNLPDLKYARTVCICEGEKDCETIKLQNLYDSTGHQIVATTSGGVETWSDQLANDLVGKRVVLMPDTDAAGERYRAAVAASLDQRGIEYRVIDFVDAGAKDVSDFIQRGGSKEDLVRRLGDDWVRVYEHEWEHPPLGSVADL